jgi:hypothetical protein
LSNAGLWENRSSPDGPPFMNSQILDLAFPRRGIFAGN